MQTPKFMRLLHVCARHSSPLPPPLSLPPRRVVVTGLGMLSPLGVGVQQHWTKLMDAQSGLSVQGTGTDARVVGVLSIGTAPHEYDATRYVPRTLQSTTSPFEQYALSAAHMAMEDAAWTSTESRPHATRFGVSFGSGVGGLDDAGRAFELVSAGKARTVSAYALPRLLINLAAGHISIAHNLQGPCLAPATACSSSAHAIADAFHAIRRGEADAMLAGGAEQGVTPLSLAMFSRLRALLRGDDPSGCRPFDAERAGFVLADGAAALVLEEREAALRRGARVYAEMRGSGSSADAYHVTSPSPDGRGCESAMRCAIESSGLMPEHIDYVNAHATSTVVGDAAESAALARLLPHALVSSTKGATGHLLGAAGALEAAITVLAVHGDQVPPSIGLRNKGDDVAALRFVTETRKHVRVRAAMSVSCAFGGTNAALVFAKHQDG